MESITSAVKTAFATVQTDAVSMISTCAPYALGIIGTVLAVTIGIKVFKKLTAQAQFFDVERVIMPALFFIENVRLCILRLVPEK